MLDIRATTQNKASPAQTITEGWISLQNILFNVSAAVSMNLFLSGTQVRLNETGLQ